MNYAKPITILLAGLQDHFNRGLLSIEAFFQSIKSNYCIKLLKWKKEKDWLEKKPRLKSGPDWTEHVNRLSACLHDQNKSGFFEGPAFSNQSELFENFSNCSEWLDSRPSKKPLLFWSCRQAIYECSRSQMQLCKIRLIIICVQ